MRLVIIESPYAGDVDANVEYARRCMRDSLFRGEAPLASHLLYTQPGVLDDTLPDDRKRGIAAGLAWGVYADATVVYGDRGISPGMQHGIDEAHRECRPVEYRYLEQAVAQAADEPRPRNTLRRPVNAIEKFRAQLMTGDATATYVSGLIRNAGRVPSETSSASTVRCVSMLIQLSSLPAPRAALSRVWPLIVAACEGDVIPADVVDGLTYIEGHLREGVTLSDKRWSARIAGIGGVGLARAARNGAVFHGRGGAKSYASGLIQAINKNVPADRRLAMRDDA